MSVFAKNVSGQTICDEEVVLPLFVAGEELTKRKTNLTSECPAEVTALINEKNLIVEYKLLVQEIVSRKGTHNKLSNWWVNDAVMEIMGEYEPAFLAKNVSLSLCERSKKGMTQKYLWLEFIDLDKAPTGSSTENATGSSSDDSAAARKTDYMSDYDVRRLEEGEVLKCEYEKIKFPKGVCVERLRNYQGRSKLKKNVPENLKALLEVKGAQAEYDALIKAVLATSGSRWGSWKDGEIAAVVGDFKVRFKVKDIDVFACRKDQLVQTGNGHCYNHKYRWLEFVDRSVLSDYMPARGDLESKGKERDCLIM